MRLEKKINPEIDNEEFYKILKFGKEGKEGLTSQLKKIIEEESKSALALSEIQGLWTCKNVVGISNSGIEIEGGISLSEMTFKNFMSEISHILIALITIGPELEKRSSQLQTEGEYTRALILDAAGSSIVENAAGKLNHIIAEKCGLTEVEFSKRFSPGYGTFKLEEQRKIAKIIPFEKIGVSLTKNCMMIPQKSITFCIYAGKVKEKIPDTCDICNQKECSYKKR
ncbi:MAG: hypothetical protein D6734_02885 [Candidatus Schekmanbacteria bacterium]|nr:MAG: hypothetical protein D6734_02885 [Candidatus Schekmanbacteria bacterium]